MVAVNTTRSDLVTRSLAGNPDLNVSSAKLRKVVERTSITIAAEDISDIGDIHVICPIPSRAVIDTIKVVNTDMDTNGSPTIAFDVGVYTLNTDGTFTVVDADMFASAVTTYQAAVTSWSDLTYESNVITNVNRHKRIWENAAATADTKLEYFICCTLTAAAATAAAGSAVWHIEYLID